MALSPSLLPHLWPDNSQLNGLPIDPLAVEQDRILHHVLADQGITSNDLAKGDAAVAACLQSAYKTHSRLQEVESLLNQIPKVERQPSSGTDDGSAAAPPPPPPGAGNEAPSPPPGTSAAAKRKRPLPAPLHHSGGSGASSLATLADSSIEIATASKGLKHFSVKVCEKVESKGSTNYNEVADELVKDLAADAAAGFVGGTTDEKNVRRRVYDALNVLEAMGIISKNKRDIEWIGWPPALARSDTSEKERLEAERARLAGRVNQKRLVAQDATAKAFCLSNLVLRNRDAPVCALMAAQQAGMAAPNPLSLPFMLVHAPSEAAVDVAITEDERSATLYFHNNSPFQIFDDEMVMGMMGLGEPQPELASSILSEPTLVAAGNNLMAGGPMDDVEPEKIEGFIATMNDATTPLKQLTGVGMMPPPGALAGGAQPPAATMLTPSGAIAAMDLGPDATVKKQEPPSNFYNFQ